MPKRITSAYKGNFNYILPPGENNVLLGEDAIKGLMNGVKLATTLIRPTYGGGGSTVIVESNLRPFHGIYNDCWNIIKAIQVKDPAEKIGLNLFPFWYKIYFGL